MSTSGNASSGGDAQAPTSGPDLGAVVRAVAGGDKADFAYVYDTFSPMVHGTTLRLLHEPELAAKVTTEAMLAIWRDSARYVPARGSVHAWVAATAHRRAVERARAEHAAGPHPADTADTADAANTADAGAGAPATPAEVPTEQPTLRLLGTLTDGQREAITEAYFDGRTYREIAAEHGESPEDVRHRIAEGMAALRSLLGAA